MFRQVVLLSLLCLASDCCLLAEEEDATEEHDTSAGLPPPYAATHLIASSTLSPDRKFAVIYPKEDDDKAQDYLVALKPFKILTALETQFPYFAHRSNGGISAQWSKDSSVALIVLDSKWGPGDILLYELHDGKVARSTNLLSRISDALKPDYQKVKPEPYNDSFEFILDDDLLGEATGDSAQSLKQCELDGSERVKVHAAATTDPKHIGGIKAWDAKFDGVWDIAQAKFTSAKVKRLFGGVRKDD